MLIFIAAGFLDELSVTLSLRRLSCSYQHIRPLWECMTPSLSTSWGFFRLSQQGRWWLESKGSKGELGEDKNENTRESGLRKWRLDFTPYWGTQGQITVPDLHKQCGIVLPKIMPHWILRGTSKMGWLQSIVRIWIKESVTKVRGKYGNAPFKVRQRYGGIFSSNLYCLSISTHWTACASEQGRAKAVCQIHADNHLTVLII